VNLLRGGISLESIKSMNEQEIMEYLTIFSVISEIEAEKLR